MRAHNSFEGTPLVGTLVSQERYCPILTNLSSIKVCMHVVRAARSDMRALRAASALLEAGCDVSLLDIEEEKQLAEEEVQGVHLRHIIIPHWHDSRKIEPLFFIKAMQAFLLSMPYLLQAKADIYHACEVTALPACYIIAKLRRKPLIFEAYELPLCDVPFSDMGAIRSIYQKLLSMLLARMIPACAAVITVSPPIVEEIKNRYHLDNVMLIRNIPPYRTVARSDRLREHLELAPHMRIALYQGNLQPDRQLDKLIRAASFLDRDVVIILMGKSFGSTQKQLEALIVSEGVADRVKIIPPVPYEELLDWTASADIGLTIFSPDYSLNLRMALPNKLFEYLMAGLPVLSSQLEAIVEIIRTYDVGQIVPSLTPKDIGEAINTMLTDHNGLVRMSSNALNVAQQEFHWEKESQQLNHLYSSVLAKKDK